MTAAELAIGARVAGVTQQDVREELWERRGLVKTYGPRGTLHLQPADELPLWMAARRALPDWRDERWHETYSLEPAQGEALLAAVGEALDGRCLTREELAEEVSRRAGSWARERLASSWADLITPAACAGLLCFGPSQGSRVTFVRPDQWLGGWSNPDPDEALATILRRYLAAYGPATHRDFARWFAPQRLKAAEARRMVESLAGEVEEVEVEGRRAWVRAADAEGSWEPGHGSLRLLSQYDCYLLGCHPRKRVVPEAASTRVSTYGRGRYEGAAALPVLLIDGVVAGMWERRARGNRVGITVEPFGKLTARQHRQLEEEAARVGEFLGVEVILSVGLLS
jgi:hypothetical protein